mmetsp:Transcript_22163/g.47875  ORF Transcript_22163/g.47875 Transcript_22163/m.47875 type:complete len:233 (-) Transcript_22163:1747-2445(-)
MNYLYSHSAGLLWAVDGVGASRADVPYPSECYLDVLHKASKTLHGLTPLWSLRWSFAKIAALSQGMPTLHSTYTTTGTARPDRAVDRHGTRQRSTSNHQASGAVHGRRSSDTVAKSFPGLIRQADLTDLELVPTARGAGENAQPDGTQRLCRANRLHWAIVLACGREVDLPFVLREPGGIDVLVDLMTIEKLRGTRARVDAVQRDATHALIRPQENERGAQCAGAPLAFVRQ